MKRCLVLGANGFLGSHLVDALVAAGYEVRAFDRFISSTNNFLPSDRIETMPGDFLNRDDLVKALKKVDYVFHFVSTTTPITAENDPLIDIAHQPKNECGAFRGMRLSKGKKSHICLNWRCDIRYE